MQLAARMSRAIDAVGHWAGGICSIRGRRHVQALVAGSACIFLAGCAGNSFYDPFRATPTVTASGPVRSPESDKMPSLIGRFATAYAESRDDPMNANRARSMYRSGVTLVSENCSDLFEYLGKARQNLTAAQKITGIGGGLAASIMAVTGVAAKPIGLVGTTIAALLAGSEVYGEAYLFSPDTAAVQKLVVEAQRAYLTAADERVLSWSSGSTELFSEAHGLVRDYQQICEVHHIRHIVNEAIANARLVAEGTSFRDDFARENDAQHQFAIANALRLPPGSLTDTVLAGLYWAITNRPVALDQSKLGDKFLTGSAKPLLSRLQARADSAAERDIWNRVAVSFGRMSAAERSRLESIVKAQLEDKPVPARARTDPEPSRSKIRLNVVPSAVRQ